MAHTCNPRSWETKAGDQEFSASLGYMARPCLVAYDTMMFPGNLCSDMPKNNLKVCFFFISPHVISRREASTALDILRPHPVTFMVEYYYKCLNILLAAGNLLLPLVFKLSLITSICVEEKMWIL